MKLRDVVILSTADWDNPFWTNKQHVAVELGRRGFRVLYVESVGLRRPTLKSRDLGRILRRLWRCVRAPKRVRDNLWVWSPLVLPVHGLRWARGVNRFLFRSGLKFWMKWLHVSPEILWTYNPLTVEFLTLSKFGAVVYHCVDDMKAVPGMPVEVLVRAERELVRRADVIFTTAPRLAEDRRTLNSNTYYHGNVADYDHFSRALDARIKIPEDLVRIPEPRLGFVGAVSGYKLDFSLLRKLAEAHPEWSIVLIGKVGEGDPWTDVSELRGLQNLHLLGPRAYSELPCYLKGLQVALLPNLLNEYTASMFPMKFFEYLAAGLPVVSVDLPALREHSDVALVTKTPEEFICAVESALAKHGPSLDARLSRAQRNTYASRTDAMLEILDGIIER